MFCSYRKPHHDTIGSKTVECFSPTFREAELVWKRHTVILTFLLIYSSCALKARSDGILPMLSL